MSETNSTSADDLNSKDQEGGSDDVTHHLSGYDISLAARNIANSPLIRLPPELLNRIFEELELQLGINEWAPLLPFARDRIVPYISLSSVDSATHAHRFLSAAPNLYRTIPSLMIMEGRTRRVEDHWGSFTDIKDVLTSLERVVRVGIVADGDRFTTLHTHAKDTLLERMALISSLTVHRFHGTFSSLIAFIAHSPQLQSLELVDTRIVGSNDDDKEQDELPTLSSQLTLKKVKLAWVFEGYPRQGYSDKLVSWVCSLCRPNTLREFWYKMPPRVVFSSHSAETAKEIERVLDHLNPQYGTLRNLHLLPGCFLLNIQDVIPVLQSIARTEIPLRTLVLGWEPDYMNFTLVESDISYVCTHLIKLYANTTHHYTVRIERAHGSLGSVKKLRLEDVVPRNGVKRAFVIRHEHGEMALVRIDEWALDGSCLDEPIPSAPGRSVRVSLETYLHLRSGELFFELLALIFEVQ
ncbi:hypothetical protein PUNSTDRAFT_130460 [Punctularia strigosozonata HHB-11173 SS5]|uniref:uncharacterized protein n=1 Tax=Punctularia strigosozonata (strain HHB-11173) TaxID=741275 RepID=UPI000441828C|nr:uncharacterized protein PUNSTDRAFT_130460 [Punctularia strigosozonata HHB-11173 SS5]EIN12191.1 hypothetical protein PUNSTDRAFT_130460 [Punctularia strigosozonata HHB-11173 SS5]